jgi:hypothetical protein
MDVLLGRTRRSSVILVALVALLVGLLPTAGAVAATTEPRGTSNVCDPPFTSTFDDIVGSAHRDNILCMADLGITEGTGDGTSYSPRRAVTRGQMASFIARYIEHYTERTLPVGTARFADVPGSYVHHDPIHKLRTAGVTAGTSVSAGASYAPQQLVTRAQMASFISRASSYIEDGRAVPEHEPPRTSTDHFRDDEGSVHERNIDALAAVGIVAGFTDGTYRPAAPVLRDQMASFVMRAYDYAVEVGLGDVVVDPDPEFGVVTGTVTDASDGAPIAGASVTITNGDDHAAITAGDGTYRVEDVEAGTYTVTAAAQDYLGASREVDVVADETLAVDFALTAIPTEFDNEITVPLHWQNQYRGSEGRFGGVDDYAAYHLDPDGAGQATFRWDDGAATVVVVGEATLTAQATTFTIHDGALRDEVAAAFTLPAPTSTGDAPDATDRGLYTYSLDSTATDADALVTLLEAGTGYVSVQTTANTDGEVRGQLGAEDGGLAGIVPIYKHLEFHEFGVGTNTGGDQTSFNLLFDAWVDYPEATQDWPKPEDFRLVRERDGVAQELEILRVRGNNEAWQPYPKPDLRIHLDTHDVIEDGDVVTVTMLDTAAAKLLPDGRNSDAGNVSDSWRTRCTQVLSVRAMTSEPCGTPPQAGLQDDFAATPIVTAPDQTQQFSVTIEEPGIPAGEELWVDLIDVSHDGLVDYSDSTWTATVGGEVVGTAEFWELMIIERFETVWEPFLVFTPTGATPVAGELVLSGTDIDGSDAAVHGADTSYDSYVVRHDTGRAVYGTIDVIYEAQPTITLEPADRVVLAGDGAELPVTATYTEADGVTPIRGAELRFWAEQGDRPDVVEVDVAEVTTDANGEATITYAYDGRDVAVGAPLIDTLSAEDTADTYVDARTTVTWAAGVAANTDSGGTFHDLNAAVIAAEAGDTITAEGEFTSEYGTPRDDRIEVRKPLTLRGNDEASLIGAFDLRANDIELSGFDITRGDGKEFAVRTEGKGIVVTGNVIDATGMNGINVRDAWRQVAGGGSATITGNTIGDAAVGIHADVDKMKGGEPVPFVLVVDLVITGNTFTDNGTAIHYSPDAGSTADISGNDFAAGDVTDVYVDDASIPEDDVALDLATILAGNTYTPPAEVIGTKIVPVDPTHEPSMVRVVEHGAGTGNKYSIVEYTRGVACDAVNGAAVGSQYSLVRGEVQTPNRVGVDVECNYDGNPSLIKITWDGNPSFPESITYAEHADPAYRIHNEHELSPGVFTDAVSPDTVGSPFPKPEGEIVSGAVYLNRNDATIHERWFAQGQTIDLVDLRVSIASRSEVPADGLDLRFEVARPGEDFVAGDTICAELLTLDSCATISGALTANSGFLDGTDFLTDATLKVGSDAALGTWQLRFSVVDVGTSVVYFSDSFSITIDAAG